MVYTISTVRVYNEKLLIGNIFDRYLNKILKDYEIKFKVNSRYEWGSCVEIDLVDNIDKISDIMKGLILICYKDKADFYDRKKKVVESTLSYVNHLYNKDKLTEKDEKELNGILKGNLVVTDYGLITYPDSSITEEPYLDNKIMDILKEYKLRGKLNG